MQLLIGDMLCGLLVGFVGQQVSHAGLTYKEGLSLFMRSRFSLVEFWPGFLFFVAFQVHS